jgi:hypothetical protein
MKNLKSLVFTLAIIFTISQASALTNDKGGNKFSQKIRSVLSTPKCLKNKSTTEKITVCFCVNENGDVTEVSAKTNNPEIKAHVEKQFMTLNLKGLQPCVTNTVNVAFVNY